MPSSFPKSINDPPHSASLTKRTRSLSSNMTGGTGNDVNEPCDDNSTPSQSNTATCGSKPIFSENNFDKTGSKNQGRNRGNAKVKLLVRSHAMREATSPPRESNNSVIQDEDKINGRNENSSDSPSSNRIKQIINNDNIINDENNDDDDKKDESNDTENCQNTGRNGIKDSVEGMSSNDDKISFELKEVETVVDELPIEELKVFDKCNSCVTKSSIDVDSNNDRSLDKRSSSNHDIQKSVTSNKLQHSPKSTNLVASNNNDNNNREQQQIKKNESNSRIEQTKTNSTSTATPAAASSSSSSSSSASASFTCNVPCSNNCGNNNNNNVNNNNNNTLSVSRPGSRHKLRHRNTSQGSFETSPSISRDSSTELYTDSTGIDLEQFIVDTLNRNQKDRTVLLRIERELVEFAKDRQRVCQKFPNMSSYNRMLVHRVAAYFGMEHNVDQSGLCVVVTRTKNTRIPDTRFKESIRDDIVLNEEPKRSILKRDSNSFEDNFNFKSPDRFIADYCRRSKSFEEREEEYERARRRIFKDSGSAESNEATSWPWSSVESSSDPKPTQLSHATIVSEDGNRQQMFLKVESFYENESLRRPTVPKSHSFGGYAAGGMLSRDNSITSTQSAGARLTKQDSSTSTCSRLSPSSSGYKSQSQRSDATISPSPSPSPVMRAGVGIVRSNSRISSKDSRGVSSPDVISQQTVIWAVTNMSSVPAGSVIIDPLTNMPYKNSDGTIYRFDIENPPKISGIETRENIDKVIEPKISDTHEQPTRQYFPVKNHHHPTPPPPSVQDSTHKRRSRYEKNNNNNNNNINNNNSRQQKAAMFTNSSTSPSLPFETQNSHTTQSQNLQHRIGSQQQQQQQQQQQTPLMKNYNNVGNVYNSGQQQQQQQQQISPQAAAAYAAGYATPTNNQFNTQGVYFMPCPRPPSAITISPYPSGGQIRVDNNAQTTDRGDVISCCNQNAVIAGYQVPGVQQLAPQSYEEVADISGSLIGMNLYDQRPPGDGQPVTIAPQQSYQHSSQNHPSSHQTTTIHRVQQQGSPAYWPQHPSQIPQTMFFVPPTPAANISSNCQNPVDVRQHLQRFAYSLNHHHHNSGVPQTTNQTAATSYVGGYPGSTTIHGLTGIQSPQGGEFTYQPTTHIIPAYYNPGQGNIQPTPIVYGVPTPPNTPTNSQISGIAPLMYVNSNGYGSSALITGGVNQYGHQACQQTSAAPSYIGATALMPNVMLQQAVPVVPIAGIRASTPSRRTASRSPESCNEMYSNNGGVRDRNSQQSQYQLPIRPGVHIVQGLAGNPRLQYAATPTTPTQISTSVGQGCARPYRLQSYGTPPPPPPPSSSSLSHISNERFRNSFDNRNDKLIRKQR